MTDPLSITADHLRALLDSDSPEAILGMIEGRVEVIEGDRVDAEKGRGALEVITRGELADQVGDDSSDEELERQAATLTSVVDQLGG